MHWEIFAPPPAISNGPILRLRLSWLEPSIFWSQDQWVSHLNCTSNINFDMVFKLRHTAEVETIFSNRITAVCFFDQSLEVWGRAPYTKSIASPEVRGKEHNGA